MIEITNGKNINILDKTYTLIFEKQRLIKARINFVDNYISVYQSELENTSHKQILIKHLKIHSKKELSKRTLKLKTIHNFELNKIAVRDQSSRWGSCSSQKNINLNWRLLFAPTNVLDYVILHELCHTVQMNHSKNFWDLVENKMPEWRESRNWLREKGKELEIKN